MKKKRYAAEQIVWILQETDRDEVSIGNLCRRHGVFGV